MYLCIVYLQEGRLTRTQDVTESGESAIPGSGLQGPVYARTAG